MGGFAPKIKVEIPKVEIERDFSKPKIPGLSELNPHFQTEPQGHFSQNIAVDPKMTITPDLHFNAAVRYTDIGLAMGKKGGDQLPPERWEILDQKEGSFPRDGMIRFRNETNFIKTLHDLIKRPPSDNQNLKTISWEGLDKDLGYIYHAASFGSMDLSGSPLKIHVEIMSEEDRKGPDWEHFTLSIHTSNQLSPLSEEIGDDDFHTDIKIHINNQQDGENLLQQFVNEYQRTGSAAAALDWLKESAWGERIFDFPPIIAEDRLEPNSSPVPEPSTKGVFQTAFETLEKGVSFSIQEGLDLIQKIIEKILSDPIHIKVLPDPNAYDEAFGRLVDRMDLEDSPIEPTTITWKPFLPEGTILISLKIATLGTQERGDFQEKFSIETEFNVPPYSSQVFMDTSREIPGFTRRERIVDGKNKSSSYATILKIHATRDPIIVKLIHLQFTQEYLRTGSVQAALDAVMRSPWGGNIEINTEINK